MRQAGVTLLELLIVIALMGIVAALVVPMFGGPVSTSELRATARQLAAGLRLARSEAVSERRETFLVVDVAGKRFKVDREAREHALPSKVDLKLFTAQNDLVSELIRARVADAPLTEVQLLSYCELMVEAGNETTRNAISGGLLAFCDHRGEWEIHPMFGQRLPVARHDARGRRQHGEEQDTEPRHARTRAGDRALLRDGSLRRGLHGRRGRVRRGVLCGTVTRVAQQGHGILFG